MENASKALIIAGAILISILLISVGIIIMNAINDPVQQGAEAAGGQAIEIFNQRFTGYLGSGVDYSTVKQFITTVNSANGQLSSAMKIEFDKDSAVKTIGDLDRKKTYKVEMFDKKPAGDTDGYYDTVKITAEQTGS